jgi:hypothetical protein
MQEGKDANSEEEKKARSNERMGTRERGKR